MKISIFWFRRDLRIEDNTAFHHALASEFAVLPIFIFDQNILDELSKDDSRVSFIHSTLQSINKKLFDKGSSLLCLKGNPEEIWDELIKKYEIAKVFVNKDYEPYALERDKKITSLLNKYGIDIITFKDQVVFEENEIVKDDGKPYTIFTPYKKKWLEHFYQKPFDNNDNTKFHNLYPVNFSFPSLSEIGFSKSEINIRDFDLSHLDDYAEKRNIPSENTTYLGPHLRFGTISIRKIISQINSSQEVFLSELIWREFFMQILFHFPNVVDQNFKSQYNNIQWKNNEKDFEKWCQGKTGYPLVDAGMHQLNNTGFMHNRVRMLVASFLCKHLLIDWRWGEAYFAVKLLDYELSSNNGNWQWAAGTGCDAAPYFRIFNPMSQLIKFDNDLKYVKKWIPEFEQSEYIKPIVEHNFARQRALDTYKLGLRTKLNY